MQIEDLLNEFVTYKKDIEGRSDNTTTQYVEHIKEFCNDMEIKDYNRLINIKAQEIKDWVSVLSNRGNSAKSRNKKISGVKQFYLFLEDEKMIDVDRRISRIKYAKTVNKEKRYMDKEDLAMFLYTIKNQRVRAAVAIMKCTGVRFSELLQITCTNIERGGAKIIGKGGKERHVWFDEDTIKICKEFINNDRKKTVERTGVETDLLFISKNGKLLSKQSLNVSLKFYAKKMGLYWYQEVSPHTFRHSFITNALDNGVPVHIIRDAVGHSNMSTTNNYAHTKDKNIKDVMCGKEYDTDE